MDSYNPLLSPDLKLSVDTHTPQDSPMELPQQSLGVDSTSLPPGEPKQLKSSMEPSPNQRLITNQLPVEPEGCEPKPELPFQSLPSDMTSGVPGSGLSNLFRRHNIAQSSPFSSPEPRASHSGNAKPLFLDAYTANTRIYRESEIMMSPRTKRLEPVHRPSAARPRGPGGEIDNVHNQNQTSQQAAPQYTILQRTEDQVPSGFQVEESRPRELKSLPLPENIPSTAGVSAHGSPVEQPKNLVDPIQYSVEQLESGPVYFPRITSDILIGTRFTAAAYNGVENGLTVQIPPQTFHEADLVDGPEKEPLTVDAQAMALDSLSIYELPDWITRDEYRTWRMVPDPATERRKGYRDCTREQLAWIEMMCSPLGLWGETGAMMNYENLSKEDVANMFFEKFGCEIPEDWTHLANHLGMGIVKMFCYRESLVL